MFVSYAGVESSEQNLRYFCTEEFGDCKGNTFLCAISKNLHLGHRIERECTDRNMEQTVKRVLD